MTGKFSRVQYKAILKKSNIALKDIPEKLTQDYFIDTEIDTVKSWTRTKNPNKPSMDRLVALADMCNCSIQDFFSDADVKRQQIAVEEISSKPEMYSNSISKAFLSTMPQGIDRLIENFLLLDEEQQAQMQETIKNLAMQNMKF